MADRLENRLHVMVCDGQISLRDAQHETPPIGWRPIGSTLGAQISRSFALWVKHHLLPVEWTRLSPSPRGLPLAAAHATNRLMSDSATIPPEDLIHDLTMSLWHSRAALRDLARRKAREPSIDDCRRITERQVEQLRRHRVLHVARGVARAHGVGSEQPVEVPAAMPIWAAQAALED